LLTSKTKAKFCFKTLQFMVMPHDWGKPKEGNMLFNTLSVAFKFEREKESKQ